MNVNNFRDALKQSFAKVAEPDEAAKAMATFDSLKEFGVELAAQVTLNAHGLKEAQASVAEYLAKELKKLPGGKIETDSIKRLRGLIEKFNKKVADCRAELNGEDVSEFAAEKAKIKMQGTAALIEIKR